MKLLPLLLLAASVSLTACDTPASETCEDSTPATTNDAVAAPIRLAVPTEVDQLCEDDGKNVCALSFREYGPPWLYYTPFAMHLDEFEKILWACEGVEGSPLTVTFSGYDPDLDDSGAFKDLQVLGLGFSFMGTPKTKACLEEYMIMLGAVMG